MRGSVVARSTDRLGSPASFQALLLRTQMHPGCRNFFRFRLQKSLKDFSGIRIDDRDFCPDRNRYMGRESMDDSLTSSGEDTVALSAAITGEI